MTNDDMKAALTFDWKSCYNHLHADFPGTHRTPLIGITGNFGEKGCELAEGYFESILRAGATPLILPPTDDTDALTTYLDHIDGLLLSGGADLNPLFVGEEPSPALHGICPRRDLCELLLIRLAFDRQIPILGICRGMQMLVTALDGSIWQDLGEFYSSRAKETAENPGASESPETPAPWKPIKHDQSLDRSVASHTIQVCGSLLNSIISGLKYVNSFHHQAVREAGPHLCIAATAPDGVIEAVESSEHKSILGVQWHPECFCLAGDDSMLPLFHWLKVEAQNYREARDVHSRIITLDSHCDTPMFFDQDIDFAERDPRILVDLHKMQEGGLDASIMVAYIPQGPLTSKGYADAFDYANSQLRRVKQLAAENDNAVAIAYNGAEIARLKAAGKRAILLGIENGYAIGRDLSLLDFFAREHGIIYMTLCHNGNNDICGSASPGEGERPLGVSAFGADVIREMNRLGILVDLSHASEQSFYDALEISQKPIVCSHSSSRALCNHPRNLTDNQLRALAKKDGVAQVTFYKGFLREEGEASILDAVAHLNHMVQVMGVEHVGIGTDFDGGGGVPGLASASELINFTRRLLRQRYSEDDLRRIWGGNFLRVMHRQRE